MDIGTEGSKKISESLKINTTLTKLDLWSDDKIMKMKQKWEERGFSEVDNEQRTLLEMKELR